jgi:transcriptional regulator with XRE-family HTH domain
MRDHTLERLTVPAHVWALPEMTKALGAEEPDIGEMLRLISKYTGASQTRLCIATSLAQSDLSMYISGKRRLRDFAKFKRLADALGIPDAQRVLLGLAPKGAEQSLDGKMERPPAPAPKLTPLEPPSTGVHAPEREADDRSIVDTSDPDAVMEIVESFAVAETCFGGGHAFGMLEQYLQGHISMLLRGVRYGDKKHGLLSAAARGYHLAALMSIDDGRSRDATSFFRQSLEIAEDIGNHLQIAQTRVCMSNVAFHISNGRRALALAQSALSDGRRLTPRMFSILYCAEARGYALLSEDKAAIRSIAASERALKDSTSSDEPAWLDYFDAERWRAETGQTFHLMNHPREAQDLLVAGIPAPPENRQRAFYMILLAQSYTQSGELERACSIVDKALEHVRAIRSDLCRRELFNLRRDILRHRQLPGVRQLLEELGNCLEQ